MMRRRCFLAPAAGLVVVCAWLAMPVPAHAADVPLESGAQLTLDRAVHLALQLHPARLAAQSEVGAAGERLGAARAGLLPQVLGAAEYLRATNNGIGDTSYLSAPGFPRFPSTGNATNSTETFDNYLMGVSAYQYLFDFGHTRGMIDEQSAEADIVRARLKFVELDLVFQVTKSYADLLAAQQQVKVFEQAVAQRGEHRHEAQVKAEAGLKPEIDTYTAQAELERAKLHLVDAQNALATAKVALDNAMGLGPEAPDYKLSDVLTYEEIAEPLDSYLKRAFSDRPDLAMLQDAARAAGARIQEFRSDYFPSIDATAGYSARGQELPANNNFDVGILISWPIFNGFRTDHEVAEAQMHQDAIRHSIEELRQRIYAQVKSSYLDWQASVQRIHRAEQAVAASRAEFDLAQKRYETGLGNIIELTDAQRRFTEDEAGLVNALAAYSIAKAALERQAGSGLPAG